MKIMLAPIFEIKQAVDKLLGSQFTSIWCLCFVLSDKWILVQRIGSQAISEALFIISTLTHCRYPNLDGRCGQPPSGHSLCIILVIRSPITILNSRMVATSKLWSSQVTKMNHCQSPYIKIITRRQCSLESMTIPKFKRKDHQYGTHPSHLYSCNCGWSTIII